MSLYQMYLYEDQFMNHLKNNFLKFVAIVDNNVASMVD